MLHKRLLFVFVAVGLVSILYVTVYMYRTKQIADSNAPLLSGEQVIQKLSVHMLLPTSKPSVAFVTDIELLKRQSAFFSGVQKGDAVIIFPEKVIIYNIQEDKIINVTSRTPNVPQEDRTPSLGMEKK